MMEGMQYIQYRVIDGTYQATLHWRVINGLLEIKEPDGWRKTDIVVTFIKDFEFEGEDV